MLVPHDRAPSPVYSSDEEVSAPDEVLAPGELWASPLPLPAVPPPPALYPKSQRPKPKAVQDRELCKALNKATRERRSSMAQALPQRRMPDVAPEHQRVCGGRHEMAIGWDANEDAALIDIVPLNKLRPNWAEVTTQLAQRMGRDAMPRTTKSVRCRWRRLRDGRRRALLPDGAATKAKNRCGICNEIKRGHICKGAPDMYNDVLARRGKKRAQAAAAAAPVEAQLADDEEFARLPMAVSLPDADPDASSDDDEGLH